jgi:hypothetical protein
MKHILLLFTYSLVFFSRLSVQSIAVTICTAKFKSSTCYPHIAHYAFCTLLFFHNEQRWFPCAALNYNYIKFIMHENCILRQT